MTQPLSCRRLYHVGQCRASGKNVNPPVLLQRIIIAEALAILGGMASALQVPDLSFNLPPTPASSLLQARPVCKMNESENLVSQYKRLEQNSALHVHSLSRPVNTDAKSIGEHRAKESADHLHY